MTISKTAIELFVSESYFVGIPEDILNHERTCKDSFLKGKTLPRKFWIMAQLSAAFIISLVFKAGSIAIISALLRVYTVIYIALGIVICFVVASKYYVGADKDGKAGSALFYSLTNSTVLAKCPLKNRAMNSPQMMAISIIWLNLHSTTSG